MNDIGFDVNECGTALQNGIWSRSVLHGWVGGSNVISTAIDGIDLITAPEEGLIKTIDAESGRVIDCPPHSNSQPMYERYHSGRV